MAGLPRFSLVMLVIVIAMVSVAIRAQDNPGHGFWGLQQDGSFVNPVMPGDFSDLDAIRVGEEFYAISSTFQYAPGVIVLKSRDLVNWAIVGHVIDDVTTISPAMNWDHMGRAGRGVWAGSIRHRQGKFFVYFGTPDEGIFMSSAAEVTGPWAPLRRVIADAGWDDPCPFWDDDGQGYLVATRFQKDRVTGKEYNVHLFRLTDAGSAVEAGSDRIIHQSPGSEANKLYKIHGMYFHYYSEAKPEGRVPMMERAHSLDGPWETRQLMHVDKHVDKEPNQGGLLELTDGRWYFVTHQGTGDWEGRAGVLLPVHWIDGWPVMGEAGPDGMGRMVWRATPPLAAAYDGSLVASDDFREQRLKPQWEWNYQPRSEAWSLTENPGALRMRAFRPLRAGDFRSVGNVLTQRAMRTNANVVTVKMLLNGMVDRQRAGLAHYARTDAEIEVAQQHGKRRLMFVASGTAMHGPLLNVNAVWLRSKWGFDGVSRFSYSTNGVEFVEFGRPYPLSWGNYRGDRIGIFTFNENGMKGRVDVLSFQYEIAH